VALSNTKIVHRWRCFPTELVDNVGHTGVLGFV